MICFASGAYRRPVTSCWIGISDALPIQEPGAASGQHSSAVSALYAARWLCPLDRRVAVEGGGAGTLLGAISLAETGTENWLCLLYRTSRD